MELSPNLAAFAEAVGDDVEELRGALATVPSGAALAVAQDTADDAVATATAAATAATNAATTALAADAAAASATAGVVGLRTTLPVNPADHGLTGTTDNTAALQAALSAAGTDGRNVHLPRRPLGQPYVVGGAGIILQVPAGVSLSGDCGATIRVKDGNGDYKAVLGADTAVDLSGLTVEGLTFDQNSGGNPVASVATLYEEGTQRFVIFAGSGSGLTVQRCAFTNLDGLNTLYLGSATMRDVRVQDNDFTLVGTSPAWHDHSTIYTSCDGSTITSNSFRGVLGANGATTAIETHGPNQVVAGNRVEAYKIGANITGITNLGSDGILVQGNAFRRVLIGVQLWSWLPTAGDAGGLRDVAVRDNYILIDRDPWTLTNTDYARGICFSQSAPVGRTLDHVIGLAITGNDIRYRPASVSLTNDYQNSAGIELVSQDAAVELQDLDLHGNRVVGALGPALRVGAKLRRAEVSRNVWVDPSSTAEAAPPSFWRSAVCMTGNADLADVRHYGNRTYDTRGAHKLVQGWATSLSGANTAARSEEWDNPVVCSDGAVLPEHSQTTGKRLSARGVPIGRRLKPGLFHTAQGGTPTTLALAVGNEYAVPFEVGSQQPADQIAANVTAVGGAGAVLRFGLRADDGTGGPGALLADFGTVPSETLAARSIAIAQVFPAGQVWLTITAQVAGCTVTAIAGWLVGASGASSVAGAIGGRSAQYQTGVTGPLPAGFTSGGQTPNAPAVFVRTA